MRAVPTVALPGTQVDLPAALRGLALLQSGGRAVCASFNATRFAFTRVETLKKSAETENVGVVDSDCGHVWPPSMCVWQDLSNRPKVTPGLPVA